MQTPVNVVLLAAGLGTRMKSKMAKVLHRAGGMALVEHVVRTALELTSPERIVVVVGHQSDKVRATLAGYGVRFAEQREQKGTGHALLCAREELASHDGLLMTLYGDCPLLEAATLRKLIDAQQNTARAATLITTCLEDPTGYGRILHDGGGDIAAIVEQKAATPEQLAIREVNSGIYCFRSDLLWKHIGEIRPDNPAQEYYLTDLVEIFRRAGHGVGALSVVDSGQLMGINTRVELAQADAILRERTVRELMLAGVTIEKPETVTIDRSVRIGRDSIVEPFARILGTTVIGEDCRVGACSIVEDSTLGDRVELGPFSIVGTSQVDSDARIGPYARLRMGNHVEAGGSVGNFVELKKTHLGAGAKAMHLAYLGDSSIGAKVNIGAGTITCNYDGVQKHRTTIHDGAFVGSNATLVAPVEIGAGSYIGAGSVVTEPVPADSLALGRGRQVVKENWAKQRREKLKCGQ
jgi:bifunctional UDP-N-acetylglucosamine pyrophosphorylase / glucosamine-1-phosphate N-acetyltransferase